MNEILGDLSLENLIEIANQLEIDCIENLKKNELKKIIVDYLEEKGSFLASGTLNIVDSYGFLRNSSIAEDLYVSSSQIKRLRLREKDYVLGEILEKSESRKSYGLKKILLVNNGSIKKSLSRIPFEELVPSYPDKQLELGKDRENISGRILDLVAPIGKGQRALIIAPPKAGKTTFISSIANALISGKNKEEVWILLIDERPEEVTDIKENVVGAKVFSSTFDEEPENHIKVTEEVIEKAKERVENGDDIIILMDSLTRLSRAYNIVTPSTGKLLSGGIDPKALYYPKNFFGAARNIRNGGSLTIIATILVDTGSKMDEVIYEEFKSTGNCDIYLDRNLAELRIFPAIDIEKTGTRKEELLVSRKKLEKIWKLRKYLSKIGSKENSTATLINEMKNTKNNEELLAKVK